MHVTRKIDIQYSSFRLCNMIFASPYITVAVSKLLTLRVRVYNLYVFDYAEVRDTASRSQSDLFWGKIPNTV